MSKVMSKSVLLGKKNLAKEFVELDNGEGVYVQELRGSAIEIIAKLQSGNDKNVEAMAKIIALSVCDEEGNPIFELSDWKAIIENNTISALTKLSQSAVKVSKLNPEAVTEAKDNLKNA